MTLRIATLFASLDLCHHEDDERTGWRKVYGGGNVEKHAENADTHSKRLPAQYFPSSNESMRVGGVLFLDHATETSVFRG